MQSHYGLYKEQGLPLTLSSSHVLDNKQLKGSEVKSSASAKLGRTECDSNNEWWNLNRCIINLLHTFPIHSSDIGLILTVI